MNVMTEVAEDLYDHYLVVAKSKLKRKTNGCIGYMEDGEKVYQRKRSK